MAILVCHSIDDDEDFIFLGQDIMGIKMICKKTKKFTLKISNNYKKYLGKSVLLFLHRD